jgi:hypothetical protein
MSDYLFNSKRAHWAALVIIALIAMFLRWYRLDNCTLCSGDEWLAIGPTFDFLEKFFRNPFTAIGFEAAAGFPFVDVGRMGPPFLYTRSVVLVWSMPYYAVVSLFDFPVSESWYRFPGTVWSLLGLWATYYFIKQLTGRRVPALLALALQATLIGHLVQSRFLVADGVFLFWWPMAAGLWLRFLREGKSRGWAYLCTMFYASSTPEALIGLAAMFSLLAFWLWQEGRIDPLKKPLAMLGELRRIFIVPPLLWLVGFYFFQVMVELKFYLHDRENFLNPLNYLGRFFGRGTGEFGFFLDRALEWYLYPHISLPLIVAALLSVLLIRRREWRAALAWGWLWAAFWIVLTLLVSNSSSNFTRIMHAMLVLGAAGLTALYDYRPKESTAFASLLVVGNLIGIYMYPLLCPLPENQNSAQAFGYLVQEYDDEWGGRQAIGLYYPTGALFAYIPEDAYISEPRFLGENKFGSCSTELDKTAWEDVNVIMTLPPGYEFWDQVSYLLRYAFTEECEQGRLTAIDLYAQENDFHLAGRLVSVDGRVHGNIWAKIPLELGDVSIEEANRLHYERYSRLSWFAP